MTTLRMELGELSYNITVGRGLLSRVGKFFNLQRKVFIVTDENVPREYSEAVAKASLESKIITVPSGEGSKSIGTFEMLLSEMLEFGMTRTDCAVAVGGGVIGDLVGFTASAFMRGVDFYNIPTTVLSSVDSSIGGKTGINLSGVKNIVGAFHQPKGVLVDVDTLKTLPKRQIANGLAESVKMALTSNGELFEYFENNKITLDNIDKVIVESLKIKKAVVECDTKETGLRKILNFGHTFAHAIESEEELSGLYHGECVAIGMLPVSSASVRPRLLKVLESLGLPTQYDGDIEHALSFISHDKKCEGKAVSVIFVDQVGSFRIEKMPISDFADTVREYFLN